MYSPLQIHNISEPRLQNEPHIDVATKKRICQNIFSSYKFAKNGETSYDEEKYYGGCLRRLLGQPMENYVTKKIDNVRAFALLSNQLYTEYLFNCLVKDSSFNFIDKYYVSEEYNLNTKSDSREDYIAGRFIFRTDYRKEISLDKMVEVPAKVLSGHDYNIEDIYLEKRDQYLSGDIFRIHTRSEINKRGRLGPHILYTSNIMLLFRV